MVSNYDFISYFPYNSIKHFFNILIGHSNIFFDEVSAEIFWALLIWIFVFLLLNFKGSLYIPGTSPVSEIRFINIFS